MTPTLYALGLLALDAVLVIGGLVLAVVFLVLAVRASGLEASGVLVGCLAAVAVAVTAMVSGCGCRRFDRAVEGALHAVRGPSEGDVEKVHIPARPPAIPLRTPWPPASPTSWRSPR
jgi:hypothetical protein